MLARDPLGATGDRLVIAHGFETKMLAGLVHEGLAAAMVGEPVEASGKTVEVVRITITRRPAGEQSKVDTQEKGDPEGRPLDSRRIEAPRVLLDQLSLSGGP